MIQLPLEHNFVLFWPPTNLHVDIFHPERGQWLHFLTSYPPHIDHIGFERLPIQKYPTQAYIIFALCGFQVIGHNICILSRLEIVRGWNVHWLFPRTIYVQSTYVQFTKIPHQFVAMFWFIWWDYASSSLDITCTLSEYVFLPQPEFFFTECSWIFPISYHSWIVLNIIVVFLTDKYSQFCSVTSCKESDTFEAVRGLKYGGLQRREKGLQSGLKQG